ncbi:MAG: hypothetical protein PHT48_04145 [Dechloromonas sp.]|nr:hypothetical protein [Dechloromonas sp.]
MLPNTPASAPQTCADFRGLSPFLRQSIAGIDLRPTAQALLKTAEQQPGQPELWLTLSYLMRALQLDEAAAAMQAEALAIQRAYPIAAARQPAQLRLLVLMTAGPLSANTPIECLLEDCAVELILYYLDPDTLFPEPPPAHDAVLVAIGDAAAHRPLLAALLPVLADWPHPVINQPSAIPNTERSQASRLLQGVPGLSMPGTWQASRLQLFDIGRGVTPLGASFPAGHYPVIVRPTDSHGGHHLARIDDHGALAAYLQQVRSNDFYLSPFVDYRSVDGLYRKYRIALLDGQAYACHMGISTHWMIHYLNAGMADDADKRAEEAQFMTGFVAFAARHQTALQAISQRSGLDYLCLDCAETTAGNLLVFEIDHAMIVHAMDAPEVFPYKQAPMHQLRDDFCRYLARRVAAGTA